MVLTEVRAGENYVIHGLDGEGETRLHLEQMGFVAGTQLSVISRMGGSLIVGVKGNKVALDKHLAKCIIV